MKQLLSKYLNLGIIFVLAILVLYPIIGCTSRKPANYNNVILPINLIPKPLHLEQHAGAFLLQKNTGIYVNDQEVLQVADLFHSMISKSTRHNGVVKHSAEIIPHGINLILDSDLKELGVEGYTLTVNQEKVVLKAARQGGLINGIQTIRQLLPKQLESESIVKNIDWTIPCVIIEDMPRFAWRGYMKDVSRTFYNPDVIKKYLDVMALYKLNVLHLHLTDDQGWRIEIKKYPKLTSKQTTEYPDKYNQPAERSGYYTQDQIRMLVAYAAERNITIVPEIDLPGHCWPALLAYPELSVNQRTDPPHVFPFLASWGHWGNQRTPNTLDPTNEDVYTFLADIFTEITELFPSEYIHFGGDEVKFQVWDDAPHVQQYINSHGLKDNEGLQSYFVARVCDIIKAKGRKPIGWNDILDGDPEKIRGSAIMSWLGTGAIKEAADKEFYTVATPTGYTYFDITQADRNDGTMSDLAYRHTNSIERIYGYEPTSGLEPGKEKYVLGIEANMWTAIPQEVKDVNVQNFPRLLAIAEIGWVPKTGRNYTDFSKRLQTQYGRLDELKVDYYRKGGYIAGTWTPNSLQSGVTELDWDVTKKVYSNGRINAAFFYTKGDNFLEIEKVDLLENGQVISSDEHIGLADEFRGTHRTKTYFYSLKVDRYKSDATYTLRARVIGKDGIDSYGNLTFNLSPYNPFSVIDNKR